MVEVSAGLTTFATMAYIIAINVRNPKGIVEAIKLTVFRLLSLPTLGEAAIAIKTP
jgi:xanthine/uracil/vitamin C permease (AzgA family)